MAVMDYTKVPIGGKQLELNFELFDARVERLENNLKSLLQTADKEQRVELDYVQETLDIVKSGVVDLKAGNIKDPVFAKNILTGIDYLRKQGLLTERHVRDFHNSFVDVKSSILKNLKIEEDVAALRKAFKEAVIFSKPVEWAGRFAGKIIQPLASKINLVLSGVVEKGVKGIHNFMESKFWKISKPILGSVLGSMFLPGGPIIGAIVGAIGLSPVGKFIIKQLKPVILTISTTVKGIWNATEGLRAKLGDLFSSFVNQIPFLSEAFGIAKGAFKAGKAVLGFGRRIFGRKEEEEEKAVGLESRTVKGLLGGIAMAPGRTEASTGFGTSGINRHITYVGQYKGKTPVVEMVYSIGEYLSMTSDEILKRPKTRFLDKIGSHIVKDKDEPGGLFDKIGLLLKSTLLPVLGVILGMVAKGAGVAGLGIATGQLLRGVLRPKTVEIESELAEIMGIPESISSMVPVHLLPKEMQRSHIENLVTRHYARARESMELTNKTGIPQEWIDVEKIRVNKIGNIKERLSEYKDIEDAKVDLIKVEAEYDKEVVKSRKKSEKREKSEGREKIKFQRGGVSYRQGYAMVSEGNIPELHIPMAKGFEFEKGTSLRVEDIVSALPKSESIDFKNVVKSVSELKDSMIRQLNELNSTIRKGGLQEIDNLGMMEMERFLKNKEPFFGLG